MKTGNRYDSLKCDILMDCAAVPATDTWTLTDNAGETVTVCCGMTSSGHYVYGYIVYWANGRTSSAQPSSDMGVFRTLRDARLHAIGFFNIYLEYFLPSTQADIKAAEATLLQSKLFN